MPATLNEFATDLTSIPWVFAWVVPGLGTHLPAALLHDALVVSDGEEKTHEGPDVSREQADRIFRDGMKALGTPLVRRWLIWAGASLGTVWTTIAPTKYWRIMMILFFGGLSFAGIVHTLDVFDYGWRLPWLGDRSCPWPRRAARRPPTARPKPGRAADGLTAHGFRSLMGDLATLTRNTLATKGDNPVTFTAYATPTALQKKAFELLGVKHPG